MADPDGTKTCRVCGEKKPAESYGKGRATCNSCDRARKQAHRSKPEVRARERAKHAEWLEKNRAEMNARVRAANGTPEGKEKAKQSRRRFYEKWRDVLLARMWLRRLDNPEWLEKERQAQFRYRAAILARRRAAMRNAVPAWADQDAIKAVYATARQLQGRTGRRYHVDHIVPLCHPLVCGLHVPANLQPLPALENQSKGNHWWPDMP